MTLYEINAAILNCYREEIDQETGEITEMLDEAQLAYLEMAKAEKVEGIACWIKNLIAEATAIKEEEGRLEKRRKAAENKAGRLKMFLAANCYGETFQSARAAVSFRKIPTVAVDDMSLIPGEYIRTKITTEPDKIALKKALAAGKVPGAHMEMSVSTIIR